MEDFDKYLSGQMSDGERRRFEKALDDDPALQAELQVREGLRQLRLQKKVDEVAAARMDRERKRGWRRILWGCAMAGLLGLAIVVWFNSEKTSPDTQGPVRETPTMEPSKPVEKEEVLPKEKAVNPERQPIAAAEPSEPPPQSFPNLRGEAAAATEMKKWLDQIWFAQYPFPGMKPGEVFGEADALLKGREYEKAYAKLQRLERQIPDNDTLRILKGYCLMYLGEGAEAIRYFDGVGEQSLPVRQLLEWYRGQCLLLSGDKAGALAVFKAMADNSAHGYQRQGRNAVRVLE